MLHIFPVQVEILLKEFGIHGDKVQEKFAFDRILSFRISTGIFVSLGIIIDLGLQNLYFYTIGSIIKFDFKYFFLRSTYSHMYTHTHHTVNSHLHGI